METYVCLTIMFDNDKFVHAFTVDNCTQKASKVDNYCIANYL